MTADSSRARSEPLLEVCGLTIDFPTKHGWVPVVDDLSLTVNPGEIVGLIGESGSGKSVTSQAIMGLTGNAGGRIRSGQIKLHGEDLLQLSRSEFRQRRGSSIAMVFQEPMSCLDPAFTIGKQLGLMIRRHQGGSKRATRQLVIDWLDRVGIADPHRRVDEYPHRLSGGMRQRVLIAQALSCGPSLLIADEPTTALDVTVQAQILELLSRLQRESGMAVILVTHDLAVVAEFCERVAVIYAGQIVEVGDVSAFEDPQHPYTSALLGCLLDDWRGKSPVPISGVVPAPHAMPMGCRFAPRCDYALDACRESAISLLQQSSSAAVRCARSGELDLSSARR